MESFQEGRNHGNENKGVVMRQFYVLNYNVRECNMNIVVNGVPLLRLEVNGQCSSRYPFNNLLLESGYATIRYEARPLRGEIELHKGAYLNCEVELYDMDSGYEPVSKMAYYEMAPHNDITIPIAVHEEIFPVSVPYSVNGWKQSCRLDRYESHIKKMVLEKYSSIYSMLRNHNYAQFEDEFREREDIMSVCLYLSEEERKDRMTFVAELVNTCTRIEPISNLDLLEFAADMRLVRLIKTDGESSLRLVDEEKEEETMIEFWLQMKQGNNRLTII